MSAKRAPSFPVARLDVDLAAAARREVEVHRHRRVAFAPGLRDHGVAHRRDRLREVDRPPDLLRADDAHQPRILRIVARATFRPETTATAGDVEALGPALEDGGDRDRGGGLDEDLVAVEHEPDGSEDLLLAQKGDAVDPILEHREPRPADASFDAAGRRVHGRQAHDRLSLREGEGEGGREHVLAADDSRLGQEALRVEGKTAGEARAAHGQEKRPGLRRILEDLRRERAAVGGEDGVVVEGRQIGASGGGGLALSPPLRSRRRSPSPNGRRRRRARASRRTWPRPRCAARGSRPEWRAPARRGRRPSRGCPRSR